MQDVGCTKVNAAAAHTSAVSASNGGLGTNGVVGLLVAFALLIVIVVLLVAVYYRRRFQKLKQAVEPPVEYCPAEKPSKGDSWILTH